MGNIYLMTTIIDRSIIKKYYELFQENNLNVLFGFLGSGTASSEVLDYLGLDGAEKAVVFSVVEEHTWIATKKGLEKKLKIDAPGGGISFIIPLSSVGGKKALQFLIESEDYQKQEETTLKHTNHELIVVMAELFFTPREPVWRWPKNLCTSLLLRKRKLFISSPKPNRKMRL